MKHKKAVIFLVMILLATSVSAQFDPSKPWHPLLQISGDNGTSSVDADDDGIVDNAANVSCVDCLTGMQINESTLVGVGAGHWNVSNNMLYLEDLSYNVSIGSYYADKKLTVLTDYAWDGIALENGSGVHMAFIARDESGNVQLGLNNRSGDRIIELNGDTGFSYFLGGNIGIGTNVPTQELTVIGTVNATSFVGDGSGLSGVGADGTGGWINNTINTSTDLNVRVGDFFFVNSTYGTTNIGNVTIGNDIVLNSTSSGRINTISKAPGIYLSESDYEGNDTFLVLDQGFFQIQSYEKNFGSYIGSPVMVNTSAPGGSLFISGDGNVGIGGASSSRFGVIGNANITGKIYSGSIETPELSMNSIEPIISLNETDASANNHWWRINADNNELFFNALNDSAVGGGNVFSLTRDDLNITALKFGYYNSPAFYINATTGNVGIGTSNPQGKLEVNLGQSSTVIFNGSGNPGLEIRTTNTAGTPYIDFANGSTSATTPDYSSRIASNLQTGALTFYTAGSTTERLTIDENGNIGIGTTTPTQELNVIGDTNVTGTVYANAFSSNSPLQLQTNGVTRIYINDTNGNVGIGTTNPNNDLTLDRYGYITTETIDGADNGWLQISGGGSATTNRGGFIAVFGNEGGSYSGDVLLRAGSPNGQIILSQNTDNTNVGIGTDSPTQRLNVIGDANITGTVYAHNYSGNSDITFTTGTNVNMIIKENGNIGIGTTTPTQELHIEGNANITGDLYLGGNITSYGADFAEMMLAGEELEPGDVVCLREDKIYRCNKESDNSVVGIVSAQPTVTGNAKNGNVPVGIVGLVDTKVKGPVERFDLLTTTYDGYAKSATVNDFGAIVGKALESCESECKIKVLVGLR